MQRRGSFAFLMILVNWAILAATVAGCAYQTIDEGDDSMVQPFPRVGDVDWARGVDLTAGTGLAPNLNSGVPPIIPSPGPPGYVNLIDTQFPQGEVFSTMLNIIPPQDPQQTPPMQISTDVRLTFKVYGNIIQRRVTLGRGRGITISGPATAMQVSVADQSISAPAGTKYSVFAQIGRGVRGVDASPPIWIPPQGFFSIAAGYVNGYAYKQVLIAAGQTFTVPIPPDVGAKTIIFTFASQTAGTAITQGNLTVTQVQQTSLAITPLAVTDPVANPSGIIPIVPGTNFVQVAVNAASPATVATSLAFGVDG